MDKNPEYPYVINWIKNNPTDVNISNTGSDNYKELSSRVILIVKQQYEEIYPHSLGLSNKMIMYGYRRLINSKTQGEFKDICKELEMISKTK